MTRAFRAPDAGYRCPIITALGLSLLLLSDLAWVPPLAAFVAVASKFVLRVRGKHVLNPANLGLAASFLLTTHAWSSPSQ